MSLLAPANAVAGMMPGGGLLPTPNPLASVRNGCRKCFVRCKSNRFSQRSRNVFYSVFVPPQMAATPFGGLGAPNMDQMAAMGIPGANLNPQVRIGTDWCWSAPACRDETNAVTALALGPASRLPEAHAVHGPKVRTATLCHLTLSPFPEKSHNRFTRRLNPLAAGLSLNPGMKADASNKEIEEAMKRVREAQSLISAAIEPGSECLVFFSFNWLWFIFCSRIVPF